MHFPALGTRAWSGVPTKINGVSLPMLSSLRGYKGGAANFGEAAQISALGEQLERSHFLMGIMPRTHTNLREAYSPSISQAFEEAFQQTAMDEIKSTIATHPFAMVPAIDLTSSTATVLPKVLVSLAPTVDDAFLPMRNSTGCACHYDPNKALDGALLEFYERQCLFASTLERHVRTFIDPMKLKQGAGKIADLVTPLTHHGNLHIAEVGYHDGVYVILIAFEGHTSSRVKFAVGCSANFDPMISIEKALHEIYQGYVFFEQFDHSTSPNFQKDEHQKIAQEATCHNSSDTWQIYPFDSSAPTVTATQLAKSPHGSRFELLHQLQREGFRLFAYMNATPAQEHLMTYIKVTSPDFLISTWNEHHRNSDNHFFRMRGIQAAPYQEIPFY